VDMEQRQLLSAVNPIFGSVNVEHQAPRHIVEAVAEQLDHRGHHALERDRAGQVLEPRDGRLGTNPGAALGQPADRHLKRRIGPQRVAVVGVLVTGRDQARPEAEHLGDGVLDPIRRPRIRYAAGQPLGDPEAALDLGEEQNTAVRGQPPGVERDLHRLAGNG